MMKNIVKWFRSLRKTEKTALVLSSGAARGLSHIGVIKALEERNISIDMIAGTSIGALVGACYAKSGSIEEFERVVLKTNFTRLLNLADIDLAVMFKGFIHGKKVNELLKTVIGDVHFGDLKIPLSVVATDAHTGEAVILDRGSVIEAVRASISMPVIFIPVKYGDRFLIDGGIVDPVPVDIARKMGADRIIVSNVILPPIHRKRAGAKAFSEHTEENIPSKENTAVEAQLDMFSKEGSEKINKVQGFVDTLWNKLPRVWGKIDSDTPDIFYVLSQTMFSMEYEIARYKAEKGDIVIIPDNMHIGILDFHRGKEAIEEGYAAAQRILKNSV
ncbi:MAG: patatin-like phospholipase family protein [Candidatus Omnitrophica bacterium]|nr:patatin-like phospholipase family protein [Candidatus Omnitrophota bacterium]